MRQSKINLNLIKMKDGHGIRKAAETIHRMFHSAENNNCILRVVIFTTAGYHIRKWKSKTLRFLNI